MKFSSGLPETACGLGSTLSAAKHISAELPGLLRRLNVRRLLDAPCGDCNWISQVDLSEIDYLGIDNDREHIERALSRRWSKSPRARDLVVLNLVEAAWPAADAALCRDFLQHLPDVQVFKVLQHFMQSGARWLISTSHRSPVNFDIVTAGDFRPLDLTRLPFGLPAPDQFLEDPPGSARILGAWHRAAVGAIL